MAFATGGLSPPGHYNGDILLFVDGTPVRGHSVTAGKIRILSPAFKSGSTGMLRLYNVVGGESQVFGSAKVYLQDNADCNHLANAWGDHPETLASDYKPGKQFPVELVLELGLHKLVTEGISVNGVAINFAKCAILYIADNKAGDIIAGIMPHHCAICDMLPEDMHGHISGGCLRSLEDINQLFENLLVGAADVVAFLTFGPSEVTQEWVGELKGSHKARLVTYCVETVRSWLCQCYVADH